MHCSLLWSARAGRPRVGRRYDKRGMRLTIDIPDELHRKLKAKAAAERRTMRKLVLDLIERRLERERVQFPLSPSVREDKIDLT